MILDARPYLNALLERTTCEVERGALKRILNDNPTLTAALSFLGDDVLWLVSGPTSQIGVPTDLMPELTALARQDGTVGRLLDEIEAAMKAKLEDLRRKLA